jgi:hypothetical protein
VLPGASIRASRLRPRKGSGVSMSSGPERGLQVMWEVLTKCARRGSA